MANVMPVYADFEIRLSRLDNDLYSVQVRIRRDTISEPQAGHFYYDEALRKDLLANDLSPESYGRTLGHALLRDALLNELDQALAAAGAQHSLLRLTVQLDRSAHELRALRWETLRHPCTDLPLASDGRILFSRFLSSASGRAVRLPPRGQTKAVIAVAASSDAQTKWGLPSIDLNQELETVQAGLVGLTHTLIGGEYGHTTRDALLTALRPGADILYLVAHGGLLAAEKFPTLHVPTPHPAKLPCLFLQHADGRTLPVAAQDLVADLAQLPTLPRLAIVVSCRSADPEIATSLAWLLGEAGVPAVLAMQGDFQMATAKIFLPALLAALQRDEPIDAAVAAGRAMAKSANCSDWWMPALFSRVSDGRIWQVDDQTYRHQLEYWVRHKQRQLKVEELRRLTNALLACPSTSQLSLADMPDLAALCEELHYHDGDQQPKALHDLDNVLHDLQLLPPISWVRIIEIQGILAKVPLTQSDLDHLYGYSRPGIGWEQPMGRDPADTLTRIVRQLAGAVKDHRGSQALVEFVRRLRSEFPERVATVKDQLDDWEAAMCTHLGLVQVSQARNDAAPPPTLVIQIALAPGVVEPDLAAPRSVSIIFDAWLLTDTARQLVHREALSLEQAAARFVDVEKEAVTLANVSSDVLPIEFVLPQELLLYPLEAWTIRRSKRSLPTTIAHMHPVFVRSLDRLHPDDLVAIKPHWESRWQRRTIIDLKMLNHPQTAHDTLVRIDACGQSMPSIAAALANMKRVMVLQTAHLNDDDRFAILGSVIDQGYPIALIVRGSSADPAQTATVLCTVLATESSFDNLPSLVMAQRQAAGEADDAQHYGHHLTLLWDNPERIPPVIFYR